MVTGFIFAIIFNIVMFTCFVLGLTLFDLEFDRYFNDRPRRVAITGPHAHNPPCIPAAAREPPMPSPEQSAFYESIDPYNLYPLWEAIGVLCLSVVFYCTRVSDRMARCAGTRVK